MFFLEARVENGQLLADIFQDVILHPGKVIGKKLPPSWLKSGRQLPKEKSPAVRLCVGNRERWAAKMNSSSGQMDTSIQSFSYKIGHRQAGTLISASEE